LLYKSNHANLELDSKVILKKFHQKEKENLRVFLYTKNKKYN
jgi:hypothetical protein